MFSRSIQADHKDLIHDIAYDYYGRRLATCSSDQSVKVIFTSTTTTELKRKDHLFYFNIRCGTLAKMAFGIVPLLGKRTPDLYGK